MATDDLDLSAFIGEFRDEARELIQTATEGLLRLEQKPDDPETLKEIARAVHTLKGNARLMGLEKMNQVTHRLENVFTAVRDGEVPFSPIMADLALDTFDLVTSAVENVCQSGEEGIDIEAVCERIDQAAHSSASSTVAKVPTPEESPTERPATPAAEKIGPVERPSAEPKLPTKKKAPKTRRRSATKRTPKKAAVKATAEQTKPDEPALSEVTTTTTAQAEGRPAAVAAPPGPEPEASKRPSDQATAGLRKAAAAAETVRVDTAKLDSLANVAGEMIMNLIKFEAKADRVRELVGVVKQHIRTWEQLRDELAPLLGRFAQSSGVNGTVTELQSLIQRCDQSNTTLLSDLQRLSQQFNEDVMRVTNTTRMIEEDVLSIRMHPVSTLFNTFPRSVRDMARTLGKPVRLELEGGETELDRKILDSIRDPLLHMVRNAVYHGIESAEQRQRAGKGSEGLVRLSAWQQGDQVFICVSDDGGGIDPSKVRQVAVARGLLDPKAAQTLGHTESLRLIFEPGFSTSETINDISGRGVGMDVVKTCVEEVRGEVRVESTFGVGTSITLVLPLTLAISRVILVRVGDQTFAIPTVAVDTTLRVTPQEIQSVEGKQAILVRNTTVPLFSLRQILGIAPSSRPSQRRGQHVLVLSHSQQRCGFLVDDLIGEQEIVAKPLPAPLEKVTNIAGAATLGTGEVVVVMHVPALVATARQVLLKAKARHADTNASRVRKKSILVVEDSTTARELERTLFESAGYDVQTAVDGAEGLEKLAERRVDLIVTDVQMPRMDGFTMIQRVKSDDRNRSIPIVVVTTRSDEADRKRGMEVGADAYLVKSSMAQTDLVDCARRLIG